MCKLCNWWFISTQWFMVRIPYYVHMAPLADINSAFIGNHIDICDIQWPWIAKTFSYQGPYKLTWIQRGHLSAQPPAKEESCKNVLANLHRFDKFFCTLITRFTGPTWGPPGADGTQVGPRLAPWSLLSGYIRRYLATIKSPASWFWFV